MELKAYRESLGFSQSRAAAALGLKSKGLISSLETGAWKASLQLALRIEAWSGGEVRALQLLDDADAAMLRGVIARALGEAAAAAPKPPRSLSKIPAQTPA